MCILGELSCKGLIVINDKGKILSFCVTQANVDDREPLKNESFLRAVFGKLDEDKGYISKKLEELLFVDSIHPVKVSQQYEEFIDDNGRQNTATKTFCN